MVRRFLILGAILTALSPAAHAAARAPLGDAKLDRELRHRAQTPGGHSRVILRLKPGVSADVADVVIRGLRGTVGRRLSSVGGQVADVPDSALEALAHLPGVNGVSLDRRVQGTLERTGATIGATFVRNTLGFDGTGVGIAVIDSGVASWHDDLGSSRVTRFVDFVNFQSSAYDDYGHGTHVAGILAGSGYDSGGRRSGIAPGATLLVEKVLDASGQGYISNVIAAIDYAIANRDALHLRVINLSVAAGVYESYTTDPLTLAAKRAVEAGLVVVSAAGNLGKGPDGTPQYGAIGAPGNAPWVITVGASSHNGTTDRSDDTIAGFSSRGPSAIDFQAKPDLVAPGVGIESLTEAGSTLFNTKPLMRLWGTVQTASEPYLSLSGTSMAAPVVSGTIALMLQANPALTPNLVKAILQYTAESHDAYNALTQGAGFLNARGAVELAQSLSTGASLLPPAEGGAVAAEAIHADTTPWSAQVIWGNHRVSGGQLRLAASAWRTDVTWGSAKTPEGQHVAWGTVCPAEGDPPTALGAGCDPSTALGAGTIVWGTDSDPSTTLGAERDNIVWGTECGGADCDPSTALGAGNIVWGTTCDTADPSTALGACDNIVWGTAQESDNIVWGTSEDGEGNPSTSLGAGNIVWGTNVLDDTENVLWDAPAIRRNSRVVLTDPPLT
jgi:subtilisin family serine protease